jgi:tRNA (uracil-5-)-methyltransferase
MVSLIYHKELDSNWIQTAKGIADKLSISIIGRSKKQVVVLGTNYITENYRFLEREFPLRLYEQCFSQTNPVICDAMLNWVAMNAPSQNADIMELHCGLGTFTIPLSFLYKKVLATENSRPSIRALEKNIEANKRKNIFFGRLSGKETLEAHKGIREFKRLNSLNLDEFNFETIFLDPPREGLDGNTLKDLKEFKNIIYISCGFDSFIRDLSELRKTHRIIKTAMFDQFPYTDHIESGAILSRIAPN